jgi:heme-degrading monooxygenase HmoA
MFAVIFEVHPDTGKQPVYLDIARALKPEILKIDGFIDVIRSQSLTREGWILSLSTWRDEKALVRWRIQAKHHGAQQKGREEVFSDYHLRVAEVVHDTDPPAGYQLRQERFDATKVGIAEVVTLVELGRSGLDKPNVEAALDLMGIDVNSPGLIACDVYDAVLTPGDLTAVLSFRSTEQADEFEARSSFPNGARIRHVRVIREYGMYDRLEAPQYYPDVEPK